MMIDAMDVAELKALVAAKGPVCMCPGNFRGCYPGVHMCGPQIKYHRAELRLALRGYPLPKGAVVARSHAFTGEGRGEWDALMKAEGWSAP